MKLNYSQMLILTPSLNPKQFKIFYGKEFSLEQQHHHGDE